MPNTTEPAFPFPEWRMSPADQFAWWTQMKLWVMVQRVRHEHLWPPIPVIRGNTKRHAWPPCWQHHTGLVRFLYHLREWNTLLTNLPLTEHTSKSRVDWDLTVEHDLADHVQAIADYCKNGHKGLGAVNATKIDLTGKARAHWTDPPAASPAAPAHGEPPEAPRNGPPATPPHREQPRRPHNGLPSNDGLS